MKKTISMLSTDSHVYAGRRLKAGDAFEARGRGDVRLLKALSRAVEATPPAPVPDPLPALLMPKRQYVRKVVEPEPEQEQASIPEPIAFASPFAEAEETPKPKRQYKRRDMTAEGSE